MKKVKISEKGRGLKGFKGVPFVVTHHPSLKYLVGIIKENLNILYMNREDKAVFSPGPMVSLEGHAKLVAT